MQSPVRASPIDQRASPRFSTKRKIFLSDGQTAWRCNLIDIAVGGGRVGLTSLWSAQANLFLIDPGTSLVHLTREVWRSDRDVGMQFIETASFARPLGGQAGAIRVVEWFARDLMSAGKMHSKAA